jgi:hypothetical protein
MVAGAYRTVFEASYLSNGALFVSLIFLAVGTVVTLASSTRRFRSQWLLRIWCVGWMSVSIWFVAHTLYAAYFDQSALKSGKCEVAEGTVHVLHGQAWGGHDTGDKVRIGDQTFEINYYRATIAYHATIAHGGSLAEGVLARVHYLNGEILKVEIAP